MEAVVADTQVDRVALSWEEVRGLLESIPKLPAYGVPRGGQIVAGMLGTAVDTPDEAEIIVDDIIDSGATRRRWQRMYPGKPFHALYDKQGTSDWVIFPWEGEPKNDGETIITRLLQFYGRDVSTDGLKDTPSRVIKSWNYMLSGYAQDPDKLLASSFDPHTYDELIVLKDISFFSTCEHHLMPFYGTVHIGYLPNGRVVGISKLARLANCFARRLQIQERMTAQIADAIMENLDARGVGVVVEAKHLCIAARGVENQTAEMVTSCMRGMFLEKPELRSEFERRLR